MANVLIVDDDLDLVDVVREVLESAGHKTHVEENGKEGLASLSTGPLPDCLLLDVDMPVLNGPAMADEMRSQEQGQEKIPIVLVSGRHDLPAIAASLGTPYFLLKGSENYGEDLLGLVEQALSERRPPRAA